MGSCPPRYPTSCVFGVILASGIRSILFPILESSILVMQSVVCHAGIHWTLGLIYTLAEADSDICFYSSRWIVD